MIKYKLINYARYVKFQMSSFHFMEFGMTYLCSTEYHLFRFKLKFTLLLGFVIKLKDKIRIYRWKNSRKYIKIVTKKTNMENTSGVCSK